MTAEQADLTNAPEAFSALPDGQKLYLVCWIARKRCFGNRERSYALKHRFEESPGGFYVTNAAFKGAMLYVADPAGSPADE
jgi:hypothetical protein